MSKKLISATIVIVLAELLSLSRMYLIEYHINCPKLLPGILLGISIGLEIIGVILLLICIAIYDKKK